jgi:predicted phage terminase large subunit-like protein
VELNHAEKLALFRDWGAKLKLADEAARYEGSLIEFIEYCWPVVEPGRPFVRGWAIEAICEHLEAVTSGEITRLLMNVPPGFTKSLVTDVFWPAWEWGPCNLPHYRYVCASYASHLTVRDNMRSRNIVTSDRYQKFWADRFKISNEQFTKVKFANDKTGWKFATSVSGVTGGERGDRVIIDDPNDPQNTESDAVRQTTNHWFLEVVPDRLNDITKSAIVIIQQRLHSEDVSGMALTNDLGYEHLMIPMEYVPSRHCVTALGWADPRGLADDGTEVSEAQREENEDELAWPERFPPEAVRILKLKGTHAYAGQYQQSPEVRGGGIFKRDWWRPWDKQPDATGKIKPPALEYIIASLDTAYTEKEENDPSALTVWGMFRDIDDYPKFILLNAWRKRLEIHGPEIPRMPGESLESHQLRSQDNWGLVEWVGHSCQKYKVDRLLIESKSAGISVAQEVRRLYGRADWGVELVEPKGDKVARAYAQQHLFSEGMIYAPFKDGQWIEWAQMVIDEAAVFPKAAHDDLVDSMTQALKHLRMSGLAMRRDEVQYERDEAVRYRKAPAPLYPSAG